MFRFELQPVLALKEKLEDHKKRELGVANTHKERLEGEKNTLIGLHDEAYNEIRRQYQEGMNVSQLKQFNYYTAHLNKRIEKKELEIVKATKEVHQKRNELLEAVKQRKILENLKEIKFEQFKGEEIRAENQIVDEIVSYKYGAVKRSE